MNELRKIRNELGMTQDQLAKWTKISKSSIAMIERGERKLTGLTKELFDHFLDLTKNPVPQELIESNKFASAHSSMKLKEKHYFIKKIRALHRLLESHRAKLRDMETQFQKAEKSMNISFRGTYVKDSKTRKKADFTKFYENTLKKYMANHPVMQNIIRINIRIQEMEIELIKSEMERLGIAA